MITPGSRQLVAKIVFAAVSAPVRPIQPMASPMEAGWSTRKQAS
jgi:hypothetical protein